MAIADREEKESSRKRMTKKEREQTNDQIDFMDLKFDGNSEYVAHRKQNNKKKQTCGC